VPVLRWIAERMLNYSTRRSDLLNHLRGQATNRAAGDLAMKQFTGTDAE
jgi:hypothetical protein